MDVSHICSAKVVVSRPNVRATGESLIPTKHVRGAGVRIAEVALSAAAFAAVILPNDLAKEMDHLLRPRQAAQVAVDDDSTQTESPAGSSRSLAIPLPELLNWAK
jgi:hypothetical protein